MAAREKKNKTSIKDVAAMAEVSTATVSHVINGTRYVSEEVTTKVKEAMKELNYVPNPVARTLRSQNSHLVGLIVPVKEFTDTANAFFMIVAQGIEQTLSKNGYKLILCNSYENPDLEKEHIQMFHNQLVDGIILVPTGNDYSYLADLPINNDSPIVFIDRKPQNYQGNCVLTDNFQGAYAAAKHLIEKGHKHIGFITGELGLTTSDKRLEGYKQALADHHLSFNEKYVKIGNASLEDGYRIAKEFMEQKEVSALFVANNVMTMGAISYFQEHYIKIPDEMAIIGFDDYEWMKIINPSLTTVKQPAYEMGQKAAEVILDCIKNKQEKPTDYMLDTSLIIRRSS
ncbi:LacI family transcriptional regulator [Bacillus sp. FJAT-27916]|uniref:LacI family DNA-binding transcriptional regulator n=1 Tax=Bacillaceae TaxID=186817 RepID=UPI0006717A5E|nr:LacI family DNA-binding transcriptional regulator [Bacillus sp. FJAT-27916]KMY45812.1 LacI family transcriptional regulator [Bacillus sp. FJAT-27916]